jgi:hypothetical protein
MTNISIFSRYPKIHAENIIGKYSFRWLKDHPGVKTVNIADVLHNNLIRFSIFKITPLLFRAFVYDRGEWLVTDSINTPANGITNEFIDYYAHMDLLPQLTAITGSGNTYTAVYAPLPHDPAVLPAPDYRPSNSVILQAEGPFSGDGRYHVKIASFVLLEKFFLFLRDEGVYDNTRIILVADHGRGYTDYENNILLPDGTRLQAYHPLLMVKDFYSGAGDPDAALETDNSFMTNADTVFFALKDIVENPVNPFTGQPLRPRKADGVNITTIGALSSYRHTKYTYNIGKDRWMYVHDNIFDPANWKRMEKQ